MKIKSNNSAK